MTGPGQYLRKQDVINRFNAIVTNQLTVSANRADLWRYGYVPGAPGTIPTSPVLGNRNDPTPSINDLPPAGTNTYIYAVFNSLNALAQRFASVRRARWRYYVTGASPYLQAEAVHYAHVSAGYSMAGWIGAGVPAGTGNYAYWSQLDPFLVTLRDQLNNVRTNPAYEVLMEYVACHVSCHSACHGSRGRR